MAKTIKRNWKQYNERKVHEVEILFDPEYLKAKLKIPEINNAGKVGRPFRYTNAMIALYTIPATYLRLPMRQVEGLARIISKITGVKATPDYTTLWRRKNKLSIDITDEEIDLNKPTTIAIDATGFKVTNRGDWIRHKWRKRRGFVKLHLAVDIETKEIVSWEVTTEAVGDNKKFKELVDGAKKKRNVNKVLADGAYDSRENFHLLAENKIEPGIKIRTNSSSKRRGCDLRQEAVLYVQENGYERWREKVGYGYRWMSETANSALKGRFGEYMQSRTFDNMCREIGWMISVYNILRTV